MNVSVAIATYNRATMVREGIEAALAQSVDAEIVVADDASTDDTWPMLTDLAARESRVRVFRHDSNTGGVENWNFAIRQTTGDYIAWCSDDDRFLPGHLEASLATLGAHPEIGLVHSGFQDAVETESGCALHTRPHRFEKDTILDRDSLLTYLTRYYDWPFHPSTIVMRRKVWDTVGPFDPKYALADTDWFIRAVEAFPVAMLARDGVLNRRHPGNWSNRLGSAKMQREICAIVENAIDRLFAGQPVLRAAWRTIWRANVRFRLLLTVQARIATGHTDAACAAWTQFCPPGVIQSTGEALIRRWSSRRAPAFRDARQSVSPL